MSAITVLNENSITMIEVKEKLDKIKKNHELSFRANKASEYLDIFAKQKIKDIAEKRKKLQDLNILRLKETQMTKIIDMNPENMDALRAVLTGENITLKQEDMQRVIECFK